MLSVLAVLTSKWLASLFYSKHVFGNDNFRTGFTLNYIDSEVDGLTNFQGTLPAVDAGLTSAWLPPPGRRLDDYRLANLL